MAKHLTPKTSPNHRPSERSGVFLEAEVGSRQDAKVIKSWFPDGGVEISSGSDEAGLTLRLFACYSHGDILRRLSMLVTPDGFINEKRARAALGDDHP